MSVIETGSGPHPSILEQFRNEFIRSGRNPAPEIETVAVPQPSPLCMGFIAQTSRFTSERARIGTRKGGALLGTEPNARLLES